MSPGGAGRPLPTASRWPHREQLRALVRLTAARPAYTLGLRAASVTVLPLLLSEFTGHAALIWMAFGGWLGTLADPGGPYRARARTMGGFALSAALLGALATLAGSAPAPIGLAILFAAVFFTGLWRVRGDAQATVGLLLAVVFSIALGVPGIRAPPQAAALRALFIFAGGLSTLVLSLSFWPFQPYRPARRALAESYRAMATHLEGMRALLAASEEGEQAWYELGKRDRTLVRAALERARFALAEIRRGRQGESERGERLLLLFELGDLLLGDLSALSESMQHLEAAKRAGALPLLESLSAALGAVARQIEEERPTRSPALPPAPPLPAPGSDAPAPLAAAALHAGSALAFSAGLSPGWKGRAEAALAFEPPGPRPSLRDALNPKSDALRHALRLAIATTTGATLGLLLGLPRAPWVTVTILIVLQPQAGATLGKALQRVSGTVLGGVAAALLSPLAHHPVIFALALFVLSLVAVAIRPISYGLFAALITPVFVLMAQQQSGRNLVSERILDTLLGGAVALVFGIVLWPSWERARLPAQLAALLRAERKLLDAALAGGPPVRARRARRELGLALANAESSLQRFLGEPHDEHQVQATMALLVGGRRLAGLLIALASSGETSSVQLAPSESADKAPPAPGEGALFLAALDGLTDAIAASRAPPPLPAGISAGLLPAAPGERAALVARVGRQLALLHAASMRLNAGPAADPS